MSWTGVRCVGACALVLLGACVGTVGGSQTPHDGGLDAVREAGFSPDREAPPRDDAPVDATSADADLADDASDASVDAPLEDAGTDAPATDPCTGALFCERFDTYPAMALRDGQLFGPWRATLRTPGGTMGLDSDHTVSGPRALHVHIDNGVTAGGRLFSNGALPILARRPTHLYGRMMMYIDPNGSSTHWTFFGVSGPAVPSSPVAGRNASYLISSLPRAGVNTYSFVDGLAASGSDPFHDCWFQGTTPMPTARWTCVAFEMDSEARRLRLSVDGGASPIVSVDDHGQGCVGSVVPDDSPWYGPVIDRFYTGAWSFHNMTGPLDVWIDDLVLDTSPVACPPR